MLRVMRASVLDLRGEVWSHPRMLSDEALTALAQNLESEQVERKSNLKNVKDRICETICAYANDLAGTGRPGYLLIGVHDNGTPANLAITDELLLELSDLRSSGKILPLPQMSVTRRSLHGVDIALVEVTPCPDPPVRYEGRVWIRVGPRRATASRDEERVLIERRQSGDVAFDQRSPTGTTVDDLDLRIFEDVYLPGAVAPDVLAENGRTRVQQLSALHLLDIHGRPNHAALLLIGREPRRWLPGAYVQFARYEGVDMVDSPILDQRELSGPLHEVLHEIDTLTKLHSRTALEIPAEGTELRRTNIPVMAIQQLVRNAV
jgi:ATP-dependent DNA helicase RecG